MNSAHLEAIETARREADEAAAADEAKILPRTHGTARHGTAQHRTAPHSTAQHRTAPDRGRVSQARKIEENSFAGRLRRKSTIGVPDADGGMFGRTR